MEVVVVEGCLACRWEVVGVAAIARTGVDEVDPLPPPTSVVPEMVVVEARSTLTEVMLLHV